MRVSRDNSFTRKNHRGRRLWADAIKSGEIIEKSSYRCPLCSSEPVIPCGIDASDFSLGVDCVAVRVPLLEETGLCEPDIFFSELKDTETGAKAGKFIHSSGAVVYCRLDMPNAGLIVEFNPSRYFDPNGTSLCPADKVIEATKAILLELFTEHSSLVPVFAASPDRQEIYYGEFEDGWEQELWITRLDLARDFMLSPEYFDLELLQDVKVKYTKATVVYRNNGLIETLTGKSGKKTGPTKIYNKHAESVKKHVRNPAPIGAFRFEQELKNKQLAKAHLHALSDITNEKVERVLREYWKKSKFGKVLIPKYGWLDYFLDQDNITEEERRTAISYFIVQEARKTLPMTLREEKQIRALAKRFGLNPQKSVTNQSSTKLRIDFETGSLIRISNCTETRIDMITTSESGQSYSALHVEAF